MLKMDQISKQFKDKKVLHDVSLTLRNGQITALVGSNGAGKSTLIGLMMGYYRKTVGKIKTSSISVMPDTFAIYDEMTGHDFLKAMSQFKHLPDMSQALELSKRLGLEKDLKTKIKSYSFGMRKKISFIQAAIGDFDTYIFDEPTSGIDAKSAREMLNIVSSIKEKGKAILLTSHNLDELEEVSDYVYILDQGVIVNEGTVEQIISPHQDVHTFIIETPDVVKLKAIPQNGFQIKILGDDLVKLSYPNSQTLNDVLRHLVNEEIIISDIYREHRKLKDVVYG